MDKILVRLASVTVTFSTVLLSMSTACFASTLSCAGDGISISYPEPSGSSKLPVVFTVDGKEPVVDEVIEGKQFHAEKDNDGLDYFVGVEQITKKGNHIYYDRVGSNGAYVESAFFQGKKYSITCTYSSNESDEGGAGWGFGE